MSLDPEFYKQTPSENFNINNDIEDIYKVYDKVITDPNEWLQCKETVELLYSRNITTKKDYTKLMNELRKKYKHQPRKSSILYCYNTMIHNKQIIPNEIINNLLIKKKQKSLSGVLVITVLTSPYPKFNNKIQKFSCEWNCYYCPNEPGQPRSYLHDEPAVLRANRNHFDAVLQFIDRGVTLSLNGHPMDKIELLILGGTWASYPYEYQEEFIRDLFYAANTFFTRYNKREKKSLFEEKQLNEYAKCKIIGITLETRPDCINHEELIRFRKYGCTRIQLGVQHTNNKILEKINRGCYNNDVKRALKLLKDNCFKIDIHLMPNLPGSNPELDLQMFHEILYNSDYQADQWKIYPTEITPWTLIQKWYEKGTFVPYSEEELLQVLMKTKIKVHPWIRLNRVIRDIPSQYVLGGVDNPSMRQYIEKKLLEQGQRCRCIRCREVKDTNQVQNSELILRSYYASDGLEIFISYETKDQLTICGFARLRIPLYILNKSKKNYEDIIQKYHIIKHNDIYKMDHLEEEKEEVEEQLKKEKQQDRGRHRQTVKNSSFQTKSSSKLNRNRSQSPFLKKSPLLSSNTQYYGPFTELKNAGLLRELHVYGKLVATISKKTDAQHIGVGTLLMKTAENIAYDFGCTSLAVIAGVGVRNYYRKIGYKLSTYEGEMMVKQLFSNNKKTYINDHIYVLVFVCFIAFICYYNT